jgi:hypothetical protein
MKRKAPERFAVLFGLVVTGTLLGGLVGAAVHVFDGPRSGDFTNPYLIPPPAGAMRPNPMWEFLPPSYYWEGRIAEGLLDGMFGGMVVSFAFAIGVGLLTHSVASYAEAAPYLGLPLAGALVGWWFRLGAFLVGFIVMWLALLLFRWRWLRRPAEIVNNPFRPALPELSFYERARRVKRLVPAVLCGIVAGFLLGSLGGLAAALLCPVEAARQTVAGWPSLDVILVTASWEGGSMGALWGFSIGGALGFVVDWSRRLREMVEQRIGTGLC